MLTVEQRLQMLIGIYAFQITSQQVEIEQLKCEVEQLKTQCVTHTSSSISDAELQP